ncbi:hypothetical protein QSH46_013430 [Xanthomonas arboricola pv. juglandis]|uniref:hypothetical protein n=1 Tax=Xanthomonas arboricola TaxID=56448 RepID=UPI00063EC548|nr:hypothetical protein [Xanthomonas arboricola]MDN0220781.1 hypothetical protein [Xanthomonas arboricola pv. juglandis]MDN0225066.1 hypothetical protein [Xanthomonas arboricola pv. juglandis]MDN0229280.1 hypothetical protein [Xanthomonas arboricola pv. juglandis]MDN0233690.1 hypothetical protein [Xanthomonas arboricola pv. juglandis]MDN0237950.1 hypothetical protein [Xanthomonas arboricola pv. juglandis]
MTKFSMESRAVLYTVDALFAVLQRLFNQLQVAASLVRHESFLARYIPRTVMKLYGFKQLVAGLAHFMKSNNLIPQWRRYDVGIYPHWLVRTGDKHRLSRLPQIGSKPLDVANERRAQAARLQNICTTSLCLVMLLLPDSDRNCDEDCTNRSNGLDPGGRVLAEMNLANDAKRAECQYGPHRLQPDTSSVRAQLIFGFASMPISTV